MAKMVDLWTTSAVLVLMVYGALSAPSSTTTQTTPAANVTKPMAKVILVSMDGFRYDYLKKANTPNFDAMLKRGVTMPFLNNTFVTLTFPNHFSLVTGLYEESHGIIANHMYDPVFNSSFTFTTVESKWWTGHETIWTTASKAGLKSGVYFWPGSEVEIEGMRPDEYRSYNGSIPFEDRITTLVKWLSQDDFDLGLLYFDEPDHAGHSFGPDSKEVKDMIERMDSMLGLLVKTLDDNGILDKVNLIVTSDHGMANVDTMTRLIDISNYANSSILLDIVEEGTTAHMRPQPGKAQELVDALSQVPHMTVMLKEDIPDKYHFKDHRRVMPVFALAEEGWQITRNATIRQQWPFRGDHGYDNNLLSMKPIFVAAGPDFKSGKKVETIKNVDIYPLICHLLGIEPAPNNGSLDRASVLLRSDSDDKGNSAPSLAIYTHLLCGLILLNLLVLNY